MERDRPVSVDMHNVIKLDGFRSSMVRYIIITGCSIFPATCAFITQAQTLKKGQVETRVSVGPARTSYAIDLGTALVFRKEGRVYFLDVRPQIDFLKARIPESTHIDSIISHEVLGALLTGQKEITLPLPRDKNIVVICEGLNCGDSALIVNSLRKFFPSTFALTGGFQLWKDAGQPLIYEPKKLSAN